MVYRIYVVFKDKFFFKMYLCYFILLLNQSVRKLVSYYTECQRDIQPLKRLNSQCFIMGNDSRTAEENNVDDPFSEN